MKRLIISMCLFLMCCPLRVKALEINNINELNDCLNSNEECILNSNIENETDNKVKIVIEDNATIDLNGYSIINYYIEIKGGSININNSKNTGGITTREQMGLDITNATLIINNIDIKSTFSAINISKSNVTVNSGKYNGDSFGLSIYSNSNVVINDGNFSGKTGIISYNSVLTINDGNFNGSETGITLNTGGLVTINNGNFSGEKTGIYTTNIKNDNSEYNEVIINSGNFNGGETGINVVIQGEFSTKIKGGIYEGGNRGLEVNCIGPDADTCKQSVKILGGEYKSLGKSSNYSSAMLATLYKSLSPENPLLISDLIDNNYVLSDDKFISKEVSGFYSFYNYTKELYVKISKLENNVVEDDTNVVHEDIPDDKEIINEGTLDSSAKEVNDNPGTGNAYYFIVILLFCVSLIILLYSKKMVKD